APWGLALPPIDDCLMFHIVISGQCRIQIEGSAGQLLHEGDLVVVPHGQGHLLSSGPGVAAARHDERASDFSQKEMGCFCGGLCGLLRAVYAYEQNSPAVCYAFAVVGC
ncbi:MAG TPA: cupin domain-containing protein, partial [Blastocatellia bacterium]|nr:cupin domain-containing protein [Blastocatellia bacterium]